VQVTEERDAQISPEASESLGARLRQLRRGRFTQRELAVKVGLDYTYLSKIENGAETPSEAAVRRLAEVLEADAEDLLARAGKVSQGLRDQAEQDPEVALLLRRLPSMEPTQLDAVLRAGGIREEPS
jgi:transcriptional regulator with XRE-family HTH domain